MITTHMVGHRFRVKDFEANLTANSDEFQFLRRGVLVFLVVVACQLRGSFWFSTNKATELRYRYFHLVLGFDMSLKRPRVQLFAAQSTYGFFAMGSLQVGLHLLVLHQLTTYFAFIFITDFFEIELFVSPVCLVLRSDNLENLFGLVLVTHVNLNYPSLIIIWRILWIRFLRGARLGWIIAFRVFLGLIDVTNRDILI